MRSAALATLLLLYLPSVTAPLCAQEGDAAASTTDGSTTGAASHRQSFAHSLGLWGNAQWRQRASAARTEVFSLYQGQWTRDQGSALRQAEQTSDWILGLGEEGKRFVQASTKLEWSQALAAHQLALNVDANAGLYRDTVAFQSLETQFLIDEEQGAEGNDSPRLRDEASLILGLSDVFRVSGQMQVLLDGELRLNRSRLDSQRDSLTQLNSGGFGLLNSWSRLNWGIQVRESELRLRNLLSENQENASSAPISEIQQRLQSAQTQLEALVIARHYLGVGYQAYRSRFASSPYQGLAGPSLSVRRVSDGPWEWSALVSALQTTGSAVGQSQTFGSASVAYRPNRQSRIEWSQTRELNLLSSYRSLTVEPFAPDAGQQYALDSQLSWEWQGGKLQWTLSGIRSQQYYPRQSVLAESLALSLRYDWSRTSQLTQDIRGNSTRNREQGQTTADRQAVQVRTGYRYSWGGGSLARGHLYYLGCELNAEAFVDQLEERPLNRTSLLLSLGTRQR